MSASFPTVTLVRHGETAWSLSGQHTGRTDLPLTERGERLGAALAGRLQATLKGVTPALVLTSPLLRARHTAELAGYAHAEPDADLAEWDYGEYEGLTTPEIRAKNPAWDLFRDPAPGGESPADVGARVDRVIARVRAANAPALLFSSGHLLRVLAARWVGLGVAGGKLLALGTASISVLGYDHALSEPVLKSWNATE